MRTIRVVRGRPFISAALAAGALLTGTATATAQPAPTGGPTKQPTTAAAPAAPAAAGDLALPTKGPDPLERALAPKPGGLTLDEVARRAMQTRRSIRVKQAELRAAQARVDQALVGFFPRVSATASYTRLSNVESDGGGGSIAFARNAGPLSAGPCPGGVPGTCVLDSGGAPVAAGPLSFPTLLNAFSLTASLAVPISDYVLRISQAYAIASHAESAKQLEVQAETLQVASDAKIALLNWARAKGQAAVAEQDVIRARAHVNDAKVAETAGTASRADVLRIEAQVAAAEQVKAAADAFEAVAAEQLRIVLQEPAEKPLELGIDILHSDGHTAPPASVETLQREALTKRLEIRALDETQYSLKKAVSLARAGYVPRVDAVANVTYANPNQRVFPQRDEWRATWDAGVRMTWTINDTFTALGSVSEAKARADTVAEQKAALMEGLRLEVMSAHTEVLKARTNIESAARGVEAAEESLRVRQLLFRTGKATSLELVDAEGELTRAQLRRIDAHVGLLSAETRLAHATGRDVK